MAAGSVKFRWWTATPAGQVKQDHFVTVPNLQDSHAVIAAVRTGYAIISSFTQEMPKPDAGGISAGGDLVDYQFPS